MAKVIKLIITNELVGKGNENAPVRRKIQLFTLNGNVVAEYDPCDNSKSWFNPQFIH